MELRRIVTMASEEVRLDFMAMERSLRATGCELPLAVIPFGERLFQLPRNSHWWNEPIEWTLRVAGDRVRHPLQYRFFLLGCGGYQVADTDLIFLRNPADVLRDHDGLIVSCHQWHLADKAAPSATLDLLRQKSSTWQSRLFNAGQFAASDPMFELGELSELLTTECVSQHAFLDESPWDQAGFNLLAALRQPPMVNLCLPPHRMESTWAGDYPNEFEKHWRDEKSQPYLIHWAGGCLDQDLPINELFFQFLTRNELTQWKERQDLRREKGRQQYRASLQPHERAVFKAKQCVKRLLRV